MLFLVFFSLLNLSPLAAQTFRGGIQGTVEDSSGAAVPGAEITATSTQTGLSRGTRTGDQGDFAITELPLGTYNIAVTKAGFRTQTVAGIEVVVSASQRVDIKLTPGQVSEQVQVSADLPLVESSGTTLGGTIDSKQASELPINGRDFTKLLVAVPGATNDPSGVSDSPGAFGVFSINGNRGRANNYLLDGTDMNDGYRNDPAINEAGVFGTPATLLPLDAIEEMAVLSNTEAEYGRNSGAIVNIVTKSGTNTLHGSGFEFFRNNALDARNHFNTKDQPQDLFHNNQFGGALGGPIIRDKTFFYVGYEAQREKVGLPATAVVPSLDQITSLGGVANPVISNLLALNPWGPLPACGDGGCGSGTTKTLQVSDPANNRIDSVIAKVDQHLGQADLLTGRYFFGDSDQSFPLALGGGSTIPGYNTVTPTRVQLVSLSLTHVFTPALLLEVRGGYNRFAEGFFPEDQSLNPASLGLNTEVTKALDFGLPLIKFGDGESAIGGNSSLPRQRVDTNWQYFTNFSYNTGRHNWKFGYEFRRTSIAQFYDLGYRGTLKFATFADFLQGNITSGGREAAGNSRRYTFENSHAFYAQDNFKMSSRLNLNLGLRWDYYGVIGEKNNQFSILNPNKGLQLVGTGGLSELYPKDLNNFAPRVGLAYDVLGDAKTIVRAGWGLAYDAFSQDFFIGHFPFNTFNPGPAYNGVGANPIVAGGPSATIATSAGPCTAPAIAIPHSALCAQPVFDQTTFSAGDIFTVDQNLRTPYVQNYNLNIERQLGSHSAITVGYVGSAGRKLFRFRDINQPNPATGIRPFDVGPLAGTIPGVVNQFESGATSNYNGLQTTFKIRNWGGFSSSLNYTWSHSIDTASDGEDFVPNAAQPDNSFNPAGEKANSNFDARHRLTWNYTFDFPKSQHMSWLLSGWSTDGLVTLMTGAPFNVNIFEDIPNFDDFGGNGEFFGRPDVIGNPTAGSSYPYNILDLSKFAVPCTYDTVAQQCVLGTTHFGNLRRNAFTGPSYKNWDMSLAKNMAFGERAKVQLRFDFFNILNLTNYANPMLPNFLVDANIDPTTGRGSGFLSNPFTPDVAVGNPFLGGGGPRNIQAAIKITF